MKKQLRNALLATAALAMGVSASAQSVVMTEGFDKFEMTLDWAWKPAEAITGNADQRGATGTPTGDAIYEVDKTNLVINKITKEGKSLYVSGLPSQAFFDITSDYAGNLILIPGGGLAGLGKIWILPAGKTSADDLVYIEYDYTELGATVNGRVDRLGRVLGDVMSDEGGLIYYATQGLQCAAVVKVANGQYVEGSTSLDSPAALNSFWIAQPWATSVEEANAAAGDDIATIANLCYLYQANGGTVYGPNDDFDDWQSFSTVKEGTSYAFDWFMMGDEQYFIYGTKSYDANGKEAAGYTSGSFNIVNAAGEVVAKFESGILGASGQVWGSVQAWPQADGTVKITNWNGRSGADVLTVKMKGQEAAPLYAVGQFQGWDPVNPVEFTYADGVYSYTFPEGTGSFKMSTKKSTVENDWTPFDEGVICVADDKRIEDNTGNTKYALYPGGNANISFGYTEGQWTVYADLANNLIWATNATNKPSGPVAGDPLYILGPGNNWNVANPGVFTYDATKKVYTYAVSDAKDGFKISTAKGDWDAFNGAGFHTAAALEANVATELLAGAPASGNITTTVAAPYTIEVAGDLKTITIVSEGKIDVPETCCVIGELVAGKWDASKVAPLKLQDDGYTYYGAVEMAGGWFRLCEKAGANKDDWAGVGTQWGGQTDGAEVTNNNAIAFVNGENAFNIVSFADYPKTLYFTVNFKDKTVTVSDVPAGVESIDADNNVNAEYYNLQGIRVNEPVKGQLYIVRQGNKVSKVIL